jgi:uncharacterized protein (TIGR02996 family)
MTLERAFLQAILETPEEDGPRLVFADWLEDQGDTDRAEFIRLRIQSYHDSAIGRRNLPRSASLLEANWARWVAPLSRWVTARGARCHEFWLGSRGRAHSPEVVNQFPRGFVNALHLDAGPLLDHAEEIFRLAPVSILKISGACTFADELARCPQLEWIRWLEFADYFSDPLDEPGLVALATSPHFKRLRALILHRNNLGDRGVQALARAPWMRTLERLDLTDNGLSSEGLAALAASTHLQRLRLLILDRNDLTDAHLECLTASPWLHHLAHLSLLGTAVTPHGARLLRQAHAGLTVVFPGGSSSPDAA